MREKSWSLDRKVVSVTRCSIDLCLDCRSCPVLARLGASVKIVSLAILLDWELLSRSNGVDLVSFRFDVGGHRSLQNEFLARLALELGPVVICLFADNDPFRSV